VVLPLVVYGAAYTAAWNVGLAQWSPGAGRWTTSSQIVLNVMVNLALLGVVGTFTALGEEIGWRGYLQPRLDAAGVRHSVLLVALAWTAFHVPVIIGAGYVDTGNIWKSISVSAALDLSLAFIWAHESYRARSLWPAVFFHSFHNTISQWLFPKFFIGGDNELWLGEAGRLPLAGYVVVAIALYLWLWRRGGSWPSLARTALKAVNERSPTEILTRSRCR
jgi:membrane protease YdiL (CAAX protease family)